MNERPSVHALPPAIAKGTSFQEGTWEICYNMTVYKTGEIWRVQSTFFRSVPMIIVQLIAAMSVTRLLYHLFKPLHQPRIVSDILGGVMLGPAFVGTIIFALQYVIPFFSLVNIETVANLGLSYHMFIMGLELEFVPIIRAGKRALSVAVVGSLVSLIWGWLLYRFVLFNDYGRALAEQIANDNGYAFWGIALASTNFADLAQVLADKKLLHSDFGRLALSSAVISDVLSWLLLLAGMTSVYTDQSIGAMSAVIFILLCVFVLRPAIPWFIRNTTTDNDSSGYNEQQVRFILSVVVLFGYVSDNFGSHSILGPFMLGTIIPSGELKKVLVDRIQTFVSHLLMPLYFLTVGLRTNFSYILTNENPKFTLADTNLWRVVAVVVLANIPKILSNYIIGLMYKMSRGDSFALGILMNTKGLMGLIILGTGKDIKVLDNRTFGVMMIAMWLMTVPVGPFLALVFKPTKNTAEYKLRNIQSVGPETELKILTCTHTSSSVSGMIDLLEASNPTRQSPICIFAVQLVEITDHGSAMLIVQEVCKENSNRSNQMQPEYIMSENRFEKYAKNRENVSIQTLTAFSSYNTMHEYICNLANEKFINIIITPFHNQFSIDGTMEDTNPNLKGVNNNLIKNSPCTVGIFVDRGLSVSQISESRNGSGSSPGYHLFAMFFFGGADDREALTYAWRMAGHPRVNLRVVRFIVVPSNATSGKFTCDDQNDDGDIDQAVNSRMQKHLDDTCMDEFRLKSMHNRSTQFVEEIVKSWEETVNIVRGLEGEYDLYLVGRRYESSSPAWSLLDYCTDYDELGPLGDLLVSSTFNPSVLIVQQGTLVDKHRCD
ncbi:hypothetical protein C1H46_044051 [Malus baccata]|uniref:Uncharacterized protein n=1 Tax=Malus baccata TaxID=106549 RepID=A0A540K859_MALBA|nr:hypothetical protein C1H46_044049 [Malus baccata]TQD70418.1 hypothetical protein C1H46_044051 [Malus baccata]